MNQNTNDLLETVIFIKDNMVTREDVHEIVHDTVHEIVDKALGKATAELRQEMHEGFAEHSERLSNLERANHKVLDELHPLAQAHSIDAVSIVRHEQRIT